MTDPEVTETMIFRLRVTSWPSDVHTRQDLEPMLAEQFAGLENVIKQHEGCRRQFWGYQVEDPKNLVWCAVWASMDAARNSAIQRKQRTFEDMLNQIFDLPALPPITIYTKFGSSPIAAFESRATEIAFLTLPTKNYNEGVKAMMEEGPNSASDLVQRVGKATGAAIGEVLDARNVELDDGHVVAIHGIFGYRTVEDHTRWRATPEHAQVIKEMADLVDLGLRSAKMPGGYIYVPDSSMFHVRFVQQ